MTTILINENTEEGRTLMNVARAMMKSKKTAVQIVADDDRLQPYPLSASPAENIASAIASARDTRAYNHQQVMEEMEKLIASWQ
ncbi:hypothetical protein M2459_002675 [Parabacteroides sp. PF5-5]|uniref:hypothetical protein n=1 Tax=unclassified Parabacteroides TaxID=2649774 RepID=UPI002474A470|nr:MULTISPECIES: hypothetical protein [unclassified Parabacteroides]MDH6306312.1 hypothetical protein [Parabacteroides sp. PH5-39]MDH6316897.1 hypothetical protein [Parabacteroides sp. PF5-13]MDH6320966.1 hypothetical protein [Parabacteroides sp. PH5-13]MDH6324698.1 hypothetical protein [Parabacteroides sp. PH5-8]MDH6328082.1 hypothetical protein [Parabacteroides sp. PH5-41]